MRVILSTAEYDPFMPVGLDVLPASDFGQTARRMNRVATLDGGAAFNDFGHSYADRNISLRWRPTSMAEEAAVARLVQTYARLTVATPHGLFLAAPQTYEAGADESRLDLLVESKLST